MPLHSYLVLTAFILMLIVLMLQYLKHHGSGSKFIGSPSIDKLYFYSGKIAIFATWGLFIVKAINPRLGYIIIPDSLAWVAVGLLYFGAFIFSLAIFSLGNSLAVGLPGHETSLKTHGIYHLSRNPIYVGVHLIALASCIYFPDLINVSFACYGFYIHHLIIREEERFLSGRFGDEWLAYSSTVGRYFKWF